MNMRASFVVRDVVFELGDDVPRYWHGGRKAVTLFFNNLSTLFPLGERFFMQSVAHYRKDLDDPELKEAVRTFLAQEGVHSREHEAYNELLTAQGDDVEALERTVARLLRLPELFGPLKHRVRLAATMALEHWTAMFGHLVLSEDACLEGAHPKMADLWRWHAAEEVEHKAVAFDVYRQTGDEHGLRCAIMVLATLIFWARVLRQQQILMQKEGIALDAEEWADLVRFLVVEERMPQRLAPLWLAYFDRDFHPWDLDDRPLLQRWRDRFASRLVRRSERRASA